MLAIDILNYDYYSFCSHCIDREMDRQPMHLFTSIPSFLVLMSASEHDKENVHTSTKNLPVLPVHTLLLLIMSHTGREARAERVGAWRAL